MADRLWTGGIDIDGFVPSSLWVSFAEVAPGVGFAASFANVAAFDTPEGLVLVDTGSALLAGACHEALRSWSDRTLHTAVFTHGHIDHCFGVDIYEAEAAARGAPPPRVVAHEAIDARFDRYAATAGYNSVINRRQFRLDRFEWPTRFRRPDETYATRLDLDVGGIRLELHHARGETDDHTWVWAPESRVLCTGDLFIWASPNCGNPQKVQRYPAEWARALREMATLGAEVMLPGHGVPVVGRDRVRQALADTAELLEWLHDRTVALMNDGVPLDTIVREVEAPARLLDRPYLRPSYDEPEFVVRNVWRLYGGWYDGNPARLKPAPDPAVAEEVAALAGGAGILADRARARAGAGDLRLACHLVEWAWLAAPHDPAVAAARAEVYGARAAAEASVMSRGIFEWAAREAREAGAAGSGPDSGQAPGAPGGRTSGGTRVAGRPGVEGNDGT